MSAWFFENMVWASVTMLLVLAVRQPVARLFGAGPAYALWLLPAARLVMPRLPSFGADLSLLPPLAVIVPVGEASAPLPLDGGPAPWVPVLLALWAGGAALFIVWQWLLYRSFLTRLSLTSRSLGGHRGLPLVESGAVQGPLALGLLDRRIVVPIDFDARYTAEEQRLALEHEAIHHRRGDIWCNLAALLILALNWFNPVAWLAFRAFRADQELACDAAVAARARAEERHDYARAMVKSASRHGLIAACPLNHADQLKRRLRMMKSHSSNRLRTLGGGAAVLALAGLSVSLGSPGIAHPHPEGEGKESQRIIIMEHKAEGAGGDEARAHTRSFTLRRGENGEIVIPEGCEEGQQLANVDEQSGDQRTRVMLCSRGEGGTPAERVERLQRVRERLAGDSHLSEEQRSRVTAALDREIARLRGQ